MFELLGLAGGLIGTIGSAAARGSANAEIERQIKNKKALSDERLGLAKTIFNGRMPGATALENNIFGNQATTDSGFIVPNEPFNTLMVLTTPLD